MQDGGKLPPPWQSSSWRLVITCPARAKRWQKDSMLQLSWRRWSWFQPGSSPSLLLGLLLLMEFQYVSICFSQLHRLDEGCPSNLAWKVAGCCKFIEEYLIDNISIEIDWGFSDFTPNKLSRILTFLIFLVVQGAPEESCPTELGACEVACAVLMVPGQQVTAGD